MNIYLIGYMAVGKTSLAKKLAARMGRDFIDLDRLIENETGRKISDLFEEFGEKEFRNTERDILLNTFSFENSVISTGGGTPCFFDNMEKINSNGISVWIQLKPEIIASRLIKAKYTRPLLLNKTTDEILGHTKELLNKREVFYKKANIHFPHNSSAASLDKLSVAIDAILDKRHP